eukprot:SM000018S03684  [mRNA]  locus=s18:780689:782728:- [translate_table: standard]
MSSRINGKKHRASSMADRWQQAGSGQRSLEAQVARMAEGCDSQLSSLTQATYHPTAKPTDVHKLHLVNASFGIKKLPRAFELKPKNLYSLRSVPLSMKCFSIHLQEANML